MVLLSYTVRWYHIEILMKLIALFIDSFQMHYCCCWRGIFRVLHPELDTVTSLWARLQWFLQERSLIRTFTVCISSLCCIRLGVPGHLWPRCVVSWENVCLIHCVCLQKASWHWKSLRNLLGLCRYEVFANISSSFLDWYFALCEQKAVLG